MKVWRNGNATLLMNKGCEAVFITESSAHSYAYEQAEMRSIGCDPHTYDVEQWMNWIGGSQHEITVRRKEWK